MVLFIKKFFFSNNPKSVYHTGFEEKFMEYYGKTLFTGNYGCVIVSNKTTYEDCLRNCPAIVDILKICPTIIYQKNIHEQTKIFLKRKFSIRRDFENDGHVEKEDMSRLIAQVKLFKKNAIS